VSTSERLLLFYAVECGLKALIMQSRRIDNYLDLPEELQIAHDIREGLKAVYAPAKLQVRTVMTNHRQDPQETVLPEHLHQVFRYGIPIEAEADVAADLQRVMEWLKERLG
jgi:hypothetical protein